MRAAVLKGRSTGHCTTITQEFGSGDDFIWQDVGSTIK
jgi:hypothetical protein